MEGSDSDVELEEEIPINSNRQIIPNPKPQWNPNKSHVRYPNRSRHGHHRRGGPTKHHHGCTDNSFAYHDTNEYFEQARQARLLINSADEIPNSTINNPGNQADLERESGARDKGKGVDHTGESPVNGSRFQWKKSYQNWKNKHGFGNPRGEGSSTFHGFNGQRKLVRNGCISPDNVAHFRGMSGYNARPFRLFAEQVAGVDDKGKGKLGASGSSGTCEAEGRIMTHEPKAVRISNEKPHVVNHRKRNHFMGKRKHSTDEPNHGQSLTSILGPPSNPSRGVTIINSFGEEYWSKEESKLNNVELADQSVKNSQVESDEILARHLQEQFNQEAQNFKGSDEEDDDAIIARVLQEEDDDYVDNNHGIMPFRRLCPELNHRDRSMEHLSSHSHFPFEGPSMQIPSRRRTETRFNSSDMDYEMLLITQLRRGLNNSQQMDLDTRLEILEALEEAYENQSDVDISDDFYSGFHDDEYEILSTLDEENYQHAGATDSEINVLPVSAVKGDRIEDACVICLEDPAVGAVMRHLPCLHRFHRECIDTWLRKRNACPVCKLAIT